MSGIVGIINLDRALVDPRLLRGMTDMLAYRGPDAQEVWIDNCAGFGHTMLRTTFESEREQQPCTLDGEVWITADARIDGRAELIRKLQAEGRAIFSSATDVELILHAFHTWGDECVNHLLGDFAFAIWDGKRRRLFCARDHFGVKLFYYARAANSLIFSNTLNCIRKHPEVADKLNELAIGDFLLFGYNPEPSTTTFADIQRLPPGHVLKASEGAVAVSRYWSLPNDGHIIRYPRASDYVDHFKELLREAVSDRLRTERVGIFMSGGLDSPALAATACDLRAKQSLHLNLRAYCFVYDQSPDEERYYSGLVAKALGIPIEYAAIDGYTMFQGRDNPELHRPEPHDWALLAITYDSLKNLMSHSRVALYGEDGDALLFPATVVDMLKSMRFGEVMADVGKYIRSHRRRPPLGLGFFNMVKGWRGNPHLPAYPKWLNQDFAARLDLPGRWTTYFASQPSHIPQVRAEAHRRITSPVWQAFFESNDPGVTRVPVEHRLPLLDLRVVDYLLKIPPLPWCPNKEIFRQAMRDTLPEPVRRRSKTPLSFDPYEVRLRRPDARWVDDFVPAPELAQYVNRAAIPRVAGSACKRNESSSSHLRPLSLNFWLQSLQPINEGMKS